MINTNLKNFINNCVATLFALSILGLLIYGFITGLEKQQVVDCNKLVSQSKEYRNFYITSQEKKNCEEVDINVTAPISDDNGLTFK